MVLKKFKVDDPLDAFAVHFGGGFIGTLATPVFMPGGVIDKIISNRKTIITRGDRAKRCKILRLRLQTNRKDLPGLLGRNQFFERNLSHLYALTTVYHLYIFKAIR